MNNNDLPRVVPLFAMDVAILHEFLIPLLDGLFIRWMRFAVRVMKK
jgi:hypothetical protein